MPLQVGGVERRCERNVVESTEALLIAAQDDLVFARLLNADSVVGEALRRVKVEHEEQACSFVNDNFVYFMLQRNIGLDAGKIVAQGTTEQRSLLEELPTTRISPPHDSWHRQSC